MVLAPLGALVIGEKDEAALVRSADARNTSDADFSPATHVATLNRLIYDVPEPYQRLLRWHFIHGLPHADIAQRLSWPIGTVKSRLFRAQLLLRDAWRAMHEKRSA